MAGKKLYLDIDDVQYDGVQNDYFRLTEYTLHSKRNDVTFKITSNKPLILLDFEKRYKYVISNPKKVIFNFPATIILWDDGTKTVVKCGVDDVWDPEKAVAMCIAKKALGNDGNYYNTIRKMLKMGDQQDAK